MAYFKKYLHLFFCIAAVLLCLCGCASDQELEPTVPKWGWVREKAEYLTVLAEPEDFILLEECVNLQYLDLTGSTCYEEMLNYASCHPEVEVVYTAPLGSLMLSNSETGAALEPGTYDSAQLLQQLKYLPKLAVLELPSTSLSAQELTTISDAYPKIQLRYSISLLGKEYLPEETRLDLSAVAPENLDLFFSALPLLPNISEIELMDANGNSTMAPADVRRIMDALPEAQINYSFDLFGQILTLQTEKVAYSNVSIGEEGEAQIRAALDILPHCTYFKLEDCGLSNETLASIREDYPNTKIVWRVHLGQYSLCTDEETLRSVYGVYNEYADILKYCTDLKYIDMGHNDTLTDISFIEYMPNLEIVILSGSAIEEVSVFSNCKKLEWLELANCGKLKNLQGLESCESLRFLNISFSQVEDLSPIKDLPLERFVCLSPQVSREIQKEFEENHPDCWVRFSGKDPYSLGWRYNDVGITRFEYYQKIRDIFNYDEADRLLAQQEAKRKEQEAASQPTAPDFPGSFTPPDSDG